MLGSNSDTLKNNRLFFLALFISCMKSLSTCTEQTEVIHTCSLHSIITTNMSFGTGKLPFWSRTVVCSDCSIYDSEPSLYLVDNVYFENTKHKTPAQSFVKEVPIQVLEKKRQQWSSLSRCVSTYVHVHLPCSYKQRHYLFYKTRFLQYTYCVVRYTDTHSIHHGCQGQVDTIVVQRKFMATVAGLA